MTDAVDKIVEKAGGRDLSIRWFRKQVKELGDINPREQLREGKLKTRPVLGKMNFFMYSPKYKDDKNVLPYYDRFPLILPITPVGANNVSEGFMGLNFHYLSVPMRVKLLNVMAEYANGPMDESTRIKLTWNRIKRNRMVQPTIKRYLMDHVKPPFRIINADEMMIAVLLPVQRFKRATESRVYADSRRIVNTPRRPS